VPFAPVYNAFRVMTGIDSITRTSYGTLPLTSSGGYRTQLYKLLAAAGRHDVQFVGSQFVDSSAFGLPATQGYHEGHSGFSFQDFITPDFDWTSHLAGYLAIVGTVDLFLLEGGTNEWSNGYTPAQALTHLGACLAQIKTSRPNAIVLVSDNVDSPAYSPSPATFNAGLAAVIATAVAGGQDVRWAGAQPGVTFSADNVHPDAAGYVTMGNNMIAALLAALPT